MTEIWNTDWIFYSKLSSKERAKGVKPMEFIVKDVVCKRIPTRFIINEKLAYSRAVKRILPKTLEVLQDDPVINLKKFKIQFIKKIGVTNE